MYMNIWIRVTVSYQLATNWKYCLSTNELAFRVGIWAVKLLCKNQTSSINPIQFWSSIADSSSVEEVVQRSWVHFLASCLPAWRQGLYLDGLDHQIHLPKTPPTSTFHLALFYFILCIIFFATTSKAKLQHKHVLLFFPFFVFFLRKATMIQTNRQFSWHRGAFNIKRVINLGAFDLRSGTSWHFEGSCIFCWNGNVRSLSHFSLLPPPPPTPPLRGSV